MMLLYVLIYFFDIFVVVVFHHKIVFFMKGTVCYTYFCAYPLLFLSALRLFHIDNNTSYL